MNEFTPLHQAYMRAVGKICAGQPLAFRWFCQVLEAALLWDHIMDDDPVDKPAANASMQAMTLEWVHNDWYVANRAALTPTLVNCLSAWRHGTGGLAGQVKAYDLYTELVGTVTLILHGQRGIDEFMPEIRALADRERLEDTRRDNPPFFIMGLPRSRTAWLAAFLTNGQVHCHHELIRQCKTPDDYIPRLIGTLAPIVGDSSPSLLLTYPEVRKCLTGKHKVVIIRRAPAEAGAAHERMIRRAGLDPDLNKSWPKLVQAFDQVSALCQEYPHFDYKDLDKMETICEISDYCTGQPFDEGRWRMFNELQVTAHPGKVIANTRILP